jgi:hypothetical protein
MRRGIGVRSHNGPAIDARNLWVEAGPIPNTKDAVEEALNHAVCDGQITLRAAQLEIARNWIKAAAALGITVHTPAGSPSAGQSAWCTANSLLQLPVRGLGRVRALQPAERDRHRQQRRLHRQLGHQRRRVRRRLPERSIAWPEDKRDRWRCQLLDHRGLTPQPAVQSHIRAPRGSKAATPLHRRSFPARPPSPRSLGVPGVPVTFAAYTGGESGGTGQASGTFAGGTTTVIEDTNAAGVPPLGCGGCRCVS